MNGVSETRPSARPYRMGSSARSARTPQSFRGGAAFRCPASQAHKPSHFLRSYPALRETPLLGAALRYHPGIPLGKIQPGLPKLPFCATYGQVTEKPHIPTRRPLPAARILALALISALPLAAAPFRLLAIGDSLSEEYRFEAPFSAPDSDIFVANTMNWVELINTLRPADFTMGNYEPSLGNYLDFRNAGYELNYGIPGYKAEAWVELLDDPEFLSLEYPTRFELTRDLDSVDAVIIFVGGNDLSLTDGDAENDKIRQFIGSIHDYVRDNAPANLPIIVATVPDIGATPAEKLSDPTAAAAARERVATLNANIIAEFGLRPDTHIARIDRITTRISDQVPFQINGTEFEYDPDPQNPPLHIFCKDGFHPSTGNQALIANEILMAINSFAPTPISLFTNREILADILGQNPDQPLLDYLNGAGDDGDSLPPLLEFLLGKNPATADEPFAFTPDGTASYLPSQDALRFADLNLLQSETLTNDWIPVPPGNLQTLPNGTVKIIPSAQKLFYKFEAIPKP